MYKSCHVLFAIYSIADRKSFDRAVSLAREFKATNPGDNECLLLGLMRDLQDRREVSIDEAEDRARELRVFHAEHSTICDAVDGVKAKLVEIVEKLLVGGSGDMG